jgi:hypothetical protein
MIMKKLSILFLIFILSVVAPAAQTNYKTYANARFGYSISYPADLLKAQGETSNSDGQVFANDDAEMRVFGTNMLLNKSLSKEYNAVVKEHGAENVTYKTLKKNFFVVSGAKDGKVFYQKTVARNGGSFVTFMIEYDAAKRGVYDKAVERMVKSFK